MHYEQGLFELGPTSDSNPAYAFVGGDPTCALSATSAMKAAGPEFAMGSEHGAFYSPAYALGATGPEYDTYAVTSLLDSLAGHPHVADGSYCLADSHSPYALNTASPYAVFGSSPYALADNSSYAALVEPTYGIRAQGEGQMTYDNMVDCAIDEEYGTPQTNM